MTWHVFQGTYSLQEGVICMRGTAIARHKYSRKHINMTFIRESQDSHQVTTDFGCDFTEGLKQEVGCKQWEKQTEGKELDSSMSLESESEGEDIEHRREGSGGR